ncbi:1-propanol dehydrogenase PduQ [Cloacibacillus porcorum]|uniref:Alcohol dehydrogenase n=1 Tax=Cloacibacillus porcorum TaxID=1197717 RepID=A0A1B2I323_9BACT|nr:1-propanol dehydrogenase PduQ [Cloacibacillus porcorum]ANZ44342.1 alcohol dehydrogenase [Cloacibacillus porcorum]MCI5865758.1 iron-containing alcohol dehydrogenase [Cloacibacillus porcorum]
MEKFSSITTIYMGKDALADAVGGARRVFIVSDPFMVSSGKISYVTDYLEGTGAEYEIFSDVQADPDIETVAAGTARIIEFKPDHVVVLGGGSPIDAAKAIVFFAHQQGAIPPCPFTAIPTTSGTGSEVSSFAVITDHKKNVKYPMVDDSLLPTSAVLNAELVMSVPPKVTADAGLDVLTHAIEAFVSTNRTDFTDAMAEKAIKLIYRYLLTVYQEPDNYEARQRVHNASCMAGIAFSNAGLGLNHAMAHTLGAKFHIAHGRANAILLPYVMSFNAGCATQLTDTAQRYAKIAYLCDISTASVRQSALNVIRMIRSWTKKMDIPPTIKAAGVSTEDFQAELPEMVEDALADACLTSAPRRCTKEDIRQVFENAYIGKLP